MLQLIGQSLIVFLVPPVSITLLAQILGQSSNGTGELFIGGPIAIISTAAYFSSAVSNIQRKKGLSGKKFLKFLLVELGISLILPLVGALVESIS
jgi:hypothetical protein